MTNIYNNEIAKSVLRIISSNKKNCYISFYNLIKDIFREYNLGITEKMKSDAISISGNNGYHVLATLYFVLKDMEQNRFILRITNNNGTQNNYEIEKTHDECPQYIHIKGSLKDFLEDNKQTNIWFSPDFDWFENHGYKTKELVEAEMQTKYAYRALIFAIFTFLVTAIASIFQIGESSMCTKILCLVVVIIIGIILVQIEGKMKESMEIR